MYYTASFTIPLDKGSQFIFNRNSINAIKIICTFRSSFFKNKIIINSQIYKQRAEVLQYMNHFVKLQKEHKEE